MSELAPLLGQLAFLVAALLVTAPLLGRYLAHVYTSPRHLAVERVAYRALRLDPDADQHWRTYALVRAGLLPGLGRRPVRARPAPGRLPLSLGPPDAGGRSVEHRRLVHDQHQLAVVLGGGGRRPPAPDDRPRRAELRLRSCRHGGGGRAGARPGPHVGRGRIGNFWADLVRGCFRVLLPAAFVAALLLVVSGVVQNLASPQEVTTLTGGVQHVPGGPVASQEAIKEIGTNGGGFYNANSSHPFENPTPVTNLLEIYLLLAIPFAMPWAYGLMVGRRRQGAAVGAVMATLWLGMGRAHDVGRDGRRG